MPHSTTQFTEAGKKTTSMLKELERIVPKAHEPLVRDALRSFHSALRSTTESSSPHYNIEIGQSHIDQSILYVQGVIFRVESPEVQRVGGEIIQVLDGVIRQCIREHVAATLEDEIYGK